MVVKQLGENMNVDITIVNNGGIDWTFGIGLSLQATDGRIYNCWSGGNTIAYDPMGVIPPDATRGNIDSIFVANGTEATHRMSFTNPCSNGYVNIIIKLWKESTKPLLTEVYSTGWIPSAYESKITIYVIENTDWGMFNQNCAWAENQGLHKYGDTLVRTWGQWIQFAINIGIEMDPDGWMTANEWYNLYNSSNGAAVLDRIRGVYVDYIPISYAGFSDGQRIIIKFYDTGNISYDRRRGNITFASVGTPMYDGSNGFFIVTKLDRTESRLFGFNDFMARGPAHI